MKNKIFILLLFVLFASSASFAEDSTRAFSRRNKNHSYTSIAFGMGVSYGNNPSLNAFIGYELPNYSYLYDNDKLSDFNTGIEFFLSVERQLKKNFSLKADYSFFLKSSNLNAYPNADFTYQSHQVLLVASYIIPLEYAFIKIGAGAGPLFSNFTSKPQGVESKYQSTGIGTKLDATLNLQISKNVGGYLNVYIFKSFQPDLKDSNGAVLLNKSGKPDGTVNLNSFSIGLRLGVEFFIF